MLPYVGLSYPYLALSCPYLAPMLTLCSPMLALEMLSPIAVTETAEVGRGWGRHVHWHGPKPCCVQDSDFGWQAEGTWLTQARRPGCFDAVLFAAVAFACKVRRGAQESPRMRCNHVHGRRSRSCGGKTPRRQGGVKGAMRGRPCSRSIKFHPHVRTRHLLRRENPT